MSILRRRIADQLKNAGRRFQSDFESLQSTDESDRESFSQKNYILFNPAISTKVFESEVEKNEFRNIVCQCIRELPVHFQDAFLLRMKDERRSLEELSVELDITQTNLSVRLYRARLFLRACLERRWLNG